MQAQGLEQHHVGKMLCDQQASRLRLAQLLHQPLDRPTQYRLFRFLLQMHDRREDSQQDARVIGGQCEVSADHKKFSAPIV
jgi:hypothetical protein